MNRKISVKAPGRINIIGEHTDYNDGFVLPAAIDRHIQFNLEINSQSSVSKIIALDINESMELDLNAGNAKFTGWRAYIYGCFQEIIKLGFKLKPVNGSFSGNIPVGSGLSSSAALEVSLVVALNTLFDLNLTNTQLLDVCHKADHNYVEVKSGIMDQFASLQGRKNKAMLLDCQNGSFNYIDVELEGYQFILINTMVTHEMANSEYNTRRNECLQGLEIIKNNEPSISGFRKLDIDTLKRHQSKLPTILINRLKHIVQENQRVLDTVDYLKSRNIKDLGNKLIESHNSLSKLYEVSCKELDFLVAESIQLDGVMGGRMMGGGFGGCTIYLVDKSKKDSFIESITKSYKDKFGTDADIYDLKIEDGAHITYSNWHINKLSI